MHSFFINRLAEKIILQLYTIYIERGMFMAFTSLTSIEETDHFIKNNNLAFIYITMPNCSVCHGLQPQMEEIFAKYPEIQTRTIDASEVTEIAGKFNVFTAPVLLLFVEGKEYIREARIVHTEAFEEKVSRIYENMVG